MVKKLLITRPNHDVPTSYLHDFCKELVRTAKENPNIHVSDLAGSEATRKNFEKALAKNNPKLIIMNGHGDWKSVTGYKEEVLLSEENIHHTKKSIVYAIACDSLEILGKVAVANGTEAYVGYSAKFMLVRDQSRSATPNKDKNALPFKKVCNAITLSLVSGLTVQSAVNRCKQEYRQLIRRYGNSDDPYGDVTLIRFALAWNLEFLGMEGNPEASF